MSDDQVVNKDQKDKIVTIDGKEYALGDLSETARSELVSLQVVDAELARLRTRLSIYQTARNAYAAALQEALAE